MQHLRHPLRRALAQPDLDPRGTGSERGEDRRDVELAAEQHRADIHVAAEQPAQLIDLTAQRVGLREHRPRTRGDQLAGLGRRGPSGSSGCSSSTPSSRSSRRI